MGMLYDFRCPRCNPRISVEEMDELEGLAYGHIRDRGEPLGCGLGYPLVCKNIYQGIRKGEYGQEARKIVRWMIRPGIYHSRDIHVCENCGDWKPTDNIKICRRKPGIPDRGSSLDREREKMAGPLLRPICYLNEREWDVVWENSHSCSRCGGRMIPRQEPENLKCRKCGGILEVTIVGHWD